MKFSSGLFMWAIYGLSMVGGEAKGQASRLQNSAEDIEGILPGLSLKYADKKMRSGLGRNGGRNGGRKSENKGEGGIKGGSNGSINGRSKGRSKGGSEVKKFPSCGFHQTDLVHVIFEGFPGVGTTFVPSNDNGLLEPGVTVALDEALNGVAMYHNGDQAKKEFPVFGQVTGICMVIQQNPPFKYTTDGTLIIPATARYRSHCIVSLTYTEECALPGTTLGKNGGNCGHPAYGSVTASGDLFSHWQYNSDVNPFDLTLLSTEGHLAVTSGTYDLSGAKAGGWFNFIHDGQWNLELKLPLTKKAACELQEYANENFYQGGPGRQRDTLTGKGYTPNNT